MERKNSTLYKSSVIAIVTDRTQQIMLLRMELIKSLLIFGITLFLVIFLIYKKTKSITLPLKKLVNNVLRITAGNFEERAEVEGKNEITTLSEKFNEMLGTIEGYYNVLEEKVRERTKEILKQKEQIEEQKKRITDSIIYAKRIQDAILPPEEYIVRLLENAFVLYKPKEIVSGDFYWVTERKERIYFAAVDCTGHGVPGAFMSMLGYAFLNEIISNTPDINANEILFQLRANVVSSLRQTDDIGSSKDGMDIALCIVDSGKKTLQFAGANNPMYLLKSPVPVDGSANEPPAITEIKADKIPIGITRKGMVPYTNHEISIDRGDMLYIFSDGYVDQFGGPEKWKFLSRNFKKMLQEICQKPLAEQRQILDETIQNWMVNSEQTDDILVMGIKI
jgi:phosphoserine phosphatase RsbU/P